MKKCQICDRQIHNKKIILLCEDCRFQLNKEYKELKLYIHRKMIETKRFNRKISNMCFKSLKSRTNGKRQSIKCPTCNNKIIV